MKTYATLLLVALSWAASTGAAQAQGHAAQQEPCYECPPQAPVCYGCFTETITLVNEAHCLGCPPAQLVTSIEAPCLGCPPLAPVTAYAVPTLQLYAPALVLPNEQRPCLFCPPVAGQPFHISSIPI
jgi:hypothetical protein